jgi:uncharacterized SAM-binding protein YcdF (DUF218 family)
MQTSGHGAPVTGDPGDANLPTAVSPEVLENARVIWDYHRVGHALRPCDVIVVLCSNDLRVADHAVEVARQGLSRSGWVVFTGGIAHQEDLLATGWGRAEAAVFAERAVQRGLDPGLVLLEPEATHTGENFARTGRLLASRGIPLRSALVVTKPFMERRALATGGVCWPAVDLVLTSPPIPFADYLSGGALPAADIVQVMVGDLERIEVYGERGFQLPQVIPEVVRAAFHRLVALGYDRHLLPPAP